MRSHLQVKQPFISQQSKTAPTLLCSVGNRTESMHGAGSPQAQRIMISRQGNLEQKKKLAKEIAGIND